MTNAAQRFVLAVFIAALALGTPFVQAGQTDENFKAVAEKEITGTDGSPEEANNTSSIPADQTGSKAKEDAKNTKWKIYEKQKPLYKSKKNAGGKPKKLELSNAKGIDKAVRTLKTPGK